MVSWSQSCSGVRGGGHWGLVSGLNDLSAAPPHQHPAPCCTIKSVCVLVLHQLLLELALRRHDDRPGDLDGHHHRRVSEVLRERRRQTQAEEERAEGSASRRAAGPDGAREGPGRPGQPDGEPGRRRRRRVRLPGVRDIRLRGYRLLPRVLRARGRVREEARGRRRDERGELQ